MKKLRKILLPMLTAFLTSCDPGMGGELKICNRTSQVVTVKYCDFPYTGVSSCDTTTTEIQPNSNLTLKTFMQHADARGFDCCPCEIDIHLIKTMFGPIKKDPRNSDNWKIPNKNQLKRSGGPVVKCEFQILPTDI